jgi:hypothetical protein
LLQQQQGALGAQVKVHFGIQTSKASFNKRRFLVQGQVGRQIFDTKFTEQAPFAHQSSRCQIRKTKSFGNQLGYCIAFAPCIIIIIITSS